MVKPIKMRRTKLVIPKKKVPKEKQTNTPLIWYGGKSRDADWIVNNFPPHDTFVDVFGGGGSISFHKVTSKLDVYNDIGNAANFFKVLREHGDELYEAIYLTPWCRDEFESCIETWREISELYLQSKHWDDIEDVIKIEWARCWYISIMQSYSKSENDKSWKVSRTNDIANSYNEHINDLPRFIERVRKMVIENKDFRKVIEFYDSPLTLFYCDPPYMKETRSTFDDYVHEMKTDDHRDLLFLLKRIKGQAVVSMYENELYDSMLKDWRRCTKTNKSMMHNNSAKEVGNRTEVIWIKEFQHGLWSIDPFESALSSSDVSRIPD